MHEWSSDNMKRLIDALPTGPWGRNTIEEHRVEIGSLFDALPAGNDLASRRLDITENPKYHNPSDSHEEDIALPMQTGSFEPKARCLICQTQFKYGVLPDVLDKEMAERENVNAGLYKDMTCAEIRAHFLCLEARKKDKGH
jgi:hypothetical protein